MWQSLFLKLGMFAATLSVVFWIGWTLPASFNRAHDLAPQSGEEQQFDDVSHKERVAEMTPAPVAFAPKQASTASLPKQTHRGLLDLNRATEEEFVALPGIGSRLADRIMAYRQSVGAFHSLDELRKVKGIGIKKFERIRPLIMVMPDSRSVSRGKKGT